MANETTKQAHAPAAVETVTFTLDGKEVTVPKGTTVLQAALAQKIQIPYFCWHPKLKPVGACRMCYVEIEKMNKLQVSCATEAMNGMVVHSASDMVKQGRRAVIEFTLVNHPLDCPTCDKGGECDLQNLTFSHGYDDSRFAFSKMRKNIGAERTTFDDKRIGPEIILNRNRCILCYKCVRANKEAFGEYDLGSYERGNITEIDSAPGREVANPFSGNLVEICPVGALTNTDWRYKIRVWLTKTAQSICPFTSSGSNILIYKEDHKNRVYRVTGRRNDSIDDGWLADVTRYGYQIIHSEARLKTPKVKKDGKLVEASWDEALEVVHKRLHDIREKKGGVCVAGLVSPTLSAEALVTTSKFMRSVLKSNQLDFRVEYRGVTGEYNTVFGALCSKPFSIEAIDTSDLIITFGSDLHREHPNEYLRIRKARTFSHPRIHTLNPYRVKSADVADQEIVYGAGCEEGVLSGIISAGLEEKLCPDSSVGPLLPFATLSDAARSAGVDPDDLRYIARALAQGKKITFIAGELVTRSRGRESIARMLSLLDRAFKISERGQLAVLARHANSAGAERMGCVPSFTAAQASLFESVLGPLPKQAGAGVDGILGGLKSGELAACLVIGTDPVSLYPDRRLATEAFERCEFTVVADLFETPTSALADVVLPISSWAEADAHFINLEGKIQKANRAIKPIHESRPVEVLLGELAELFGARLFESASARVDAIRKLAAPTAQSPMPEVQEKVSVQTAHASADFQYPLYLVDDPHHVGHLTEYAPSLTRFCHEATADVSESLAAKLGVQPGDTVRVESAVGKVMLKVTIDELRTGDEVLISRNFASAQVNKLIDRSSRVDRVRLTRVEG